MIPAMGSVLCDCGRTCLVDIDARGMSAKCECPKCKREIAPRPVSETPRAAE